MLKSAENRYAFFMGLAIALSAIIVTVSPRFLGVWPMVVGLLGYMAYRVVYGQWAMPSRLVWQSLLAVVGVSALSLLWSTDFDVSSERFLKLLPVFLGTFLLLAQNNEALSKVFQRFFPPFVVIATSLCAIDLYMQGSIYRFVNELFDPSKDFSGSPLNMSVLNRSVTFLVLGHWIAYHLVRFKEGAHKWLWIAALAIPLLAMVVQAESQSAQLALLFGGLFYWLFPVGIAAFWYVLGGAILSVMCVLPWVMPFVFDSVHEQLSTTVWVEDSSIQEVVRTQNWLSRSYAPERLEIWSFIGEYIQNNPLYGYGIEATRAIKDFDVKELYYKGTTVLHPHNLFLQIWIEFGALGVALLGAFFVQLLRLIKAQDPAVARMCLATLVAVMVIALTAYGMWQSWWLGSLAVLAVSALWASQIRADDA